jgi:UDP-N-acetylmuramate--alanine ligase
VKWKIHFIGVGGIGMSGLAAVSLAKGNAVTGSDLEGNNLIEELCRQGARISRGHDADNVEDDVNLIVRSACICDDNPEVIRGKEMGIPVIFRGEYLKIIMDEAPVSIAVTGTHGKTTTSGLIAHIMEYCGKDPTVIVGGEIESLGSNAKYGQGGILVAEVDESDGSFREISSTYALVTNIEREHMDHYVSMENLIEAYRGFAGLISPQGCFFFNGEDPAASRLSLEVERKRINFGIDGDFQVTCKDPAYAKSIEFDLIFAGMDCGKIKSPLIGRHNVMNLLGAIAVCLSAGLDIQKVSEAVESFSGVKRRFDSMGKAGTVEVIEDYAHHPTEISAVIRSARDYGEGRVVTVFQPHRYSRTHDLAREFLSCFHDSDVLILTDIYSAFEKDAKKIGIRDIFEKIDKNDFDIMEFVEKERIPEYVSEIVRENDVVLVLGAGDIREVSGRILEKIRKKIENT